MGTLRQKMIAALQNASMDQRQLSQALGVREKEIALHLPHIAKSVAARKMKWQVEPAFCEDVIDHVGDRLVATQLEWLDHRAAQPGVPTFAAAMVFTIGHVSEARMLKARLGHSPLPGKIERSGGACLRTNQQEPDPEAYKTDGTTRGVREALRASAQMVFAPRL